jgi:hypothetical protein
MPGLPICFSIGHDLDAYGVHETRSRAKTEMTSKKTIFKKLSDIQMPDIEKIRERARYAIDSANRQMNEGTSPYIVFFMKQIIQANLDVCEDIKKAFDMKDEIERRMGEHDDLCKDIIKQLETTKGPKLQYDIQRVFKLHDELIKQTSIVEELLSDKKISRINELNSLYFELQKQNGVMDQDELEENWKSAMEGWDRMMERKKERMSES